MKRKQSKMLPCFLSQGGSLHGEYVDATPFANSKKANEKTQPKSETLVDELGEMLKVKGFNYYGLEQGLKYREFRKYRWCKNTDISMEISRKYRYR
ncbi:unnamed protein product [Prunus armeniaca]